MCTHEFPPQVRFTDEAESVPAPLRKSGIDLLLPAQDGFADIFPSTYHEILLRAAKKPLPRRCLQTLLQTLTPTSRPAHVPTEPAQWSPASDCRATSRQAFASGLQACRQYPCHFG